MYLKGKKVNFVITLQSSTDWDFCELKKETEVYVLKLFYKKSSAPGWLVYNDDALTV